MALGIRGGKAKYVPIDPIPGSIPGMLDPRHSASAGAVAFSPSIATSVARGLVYDSSEPQSKGEGVAALLKDIEANKATYKKETKKITKQYNDDIASLEKTQKTEIDKLNKAITDNNIITKKTIDQLEKDKVQLKKDYDTNVALKVTEIKGYLATIAAQNKTIENLEANEKKQKERITVLNQQIADYDVVLLAQQQRLDSVLNDLLILEEQLQILEIDKGVNQADIILLKEKIALLEHEINVVMHSDLEKIINEKKIIIAEKESLLEKNKEQISIGSILKIEITDLKGIIGKLQDLLTQSNRGRETAQQQTQTTEAQLQKVIAEKEQVISEQSQTINEHDQILNASKQEIVNQQKVIDLQVVEINNKEQQIFTTNQIINAGLETDILSIHDGIGDAGEFVYTTYVTDQLGLDDSFDFATQPLINTIMPLAPDLIIPPANELRKQQIFIFSQEGFKNFFPWALIIATVVMSQT